MITLYVKTGCPFCGKVLRKVEELGIEIDEQNIADEHVADALLAHGGKRQVPYLIDPECDVAMYESDAIVEYLEKRFGKGKAAAGDPAVCPTE